MALVSANRISVTASKLMNTADIVDELREPMIEGEMTTLGKNEVVPLPEYPKKIKRRESLTKKLEEVKNGWTKSKYFVGEKGRMVAGILGQVTSSAHPLLRHTRHSADLIPSDDDSGDNVPREHTAQKQMVCAVDEMGRPAIQQPSRAPAAVDAPSLPQNYGSLQDSDSDELFPQCRFCPQTFGSNALRSNHEAEAHRGEDRVYPKCNKCGQTFQTPRLHDQHMEDRHPRCGRCFAPFSNKQARDRHAQRAHPAWCPNKGRDLQAVEEEGSEHRDSRRSSREVYFDANEGTAEGTAEGGEGVDGAEGE